MRGAPAAASDAGCAACAVVPPEAPPVASPVKGWPASALRLACAGAAACARVHAVDSVYRWKGQLETATEFVVELKTTAARREVVEGVIRELHNYELPEVVVRPILGGSRAYLEWISSEVS